MARWYLYLNCWKEQECALCGGTFRYRVNRRVKGEGHNNASAERHATSMRTAEAKTFVALRPCPHCGCFQPDMISRYRVRAQAVAFVAALALFWTPGMPYEFGWGVLSVFVAGAALAALFWLAHAAFLLWRPNRNLAANLRKARALEKNGSLEAVAPPPGERKEATGLLLHGTDRRQFLALGASLMLIVVAAAPLWLPFVMGWPLSWRTWPPAVGVGDTVVINGDGFSHHPGPANDLVARVESADDPALVGAMWPAEWVEGRREKGKPPEWDVAVSIPNDPALAGQRITLVLEAKVNWVQGVKRRTGTTTQRVTIRPAPYPVALWHRASIFVAIGALVAFHLPLLYLWVRAILYARLALPGRMRPIDESEDEPAEGVPAAPADGIQRHRRAGKEATTRPRNDEPG